MYIKLSSNYKGDEVASNPVSLEKRSEYMEALEEASTKQDIEPFTKFLGALVQGALAGKEVPPLPSD